MTSLDGLERLHNLAKMYGLRPSSLVESEDWSALRRFRFDEAVMIAGIYAERRATEEARSPKEDEPQMREALVGGPNGVEPPSGGGPVPAANRQTPALSQGQRPEIDFATGSLVGGVVPFIGDD